uniref:Phage protein n=1 Tax=Panagrellus redivivus TaxID=6233 RepID=A0A7E4W2Q6_PANRE
MTSSTIYVDSILAQAEIFVEKSVSTTCISDSVPTSVIHATIITILNNALQTELLPIDGLTAGYRARHFMQFLEARKDGMSEKKLSYIEQMINRVIRNYRDRAAAALHVNISRFTCGQH